MAEARVRRPAPSIEEKLAIYENVLAVGALGVGRTVSSIAEETQVAALGAEEDMMQEGTEPGAGGLIAPRRLPNPCLDSPQRMDLHKELLFNQRIGKNVLNQKSELQKALSRHKEKKILNQEKEHKETPELERAIAERARRLELAEHGEAPPPDPATNPHYQEVRARLRHAQTAATPAQ